MIPVSPPSSGALGSIRISLAVAEGLSINAPNTHPAGDGTFRLANISPDRYLVRVSGLPDNLYLKSVQCGGQGVMRGFFDADSASTLDIVLAANAASVSDGSFAIASLAPGEYRVAAWESAGPGQVLDREFRARFESQATVVQLDQGTQKVVELKPADSNAR